MRRRLGTAAVALAFVGSVLVLRGVAPVAAFGPGDVTPPTVLVAGEIIGPHTPLNDVVVGFDDVLDPTTIPSGADLADFDVEVDFVRNNVTSAQLTHVGFGSPEQINSFVTLFLDHPITDGSTVTVAYSPGDHPIRDQAGNAAQASGEIGLAATEIPTFEVIAAIVDGYFGANHLGLLLPDPIAGPLPAASAFSVRRNTDAAVSPTSVSILPEFGGRILDLALPFGFVTDDGAVITYTKPATNPLRNGFGDEAPGFTDTGAFLALVTADSTTDSTSVTVGTGGSASTDTGATGTTAQDPLATTVTVPASATISISEGNTTTAPTSDLTFLDQSVEISVVPAGTIANPIVLDFKLDGSVLEAFGADEQTLDILRNGAIVQGCSPDSDGTASPDPCLASRTRVPSSGTPWYAEFVIRTSAASEWTFAVGRFRAPVDAPPIVNTVAAGRGVPVKFGLGGNLGLNIFATGYPKSQAVSCDTKAPSDAVEATVTAGASALSFDSATQTYSYVWKTEKSWSGTCRQLILKFIDGTTRIAVFRFS
ncbi:MAG TPA: PxKF domain-containing protein [Ilumatobacteraceae bacterium]|nr:PxKF domain-containing protein [Ilumatobacteraceae bacterium]